MRKPTKRDLVTKKLDDARVKLFWLRNLLHIQEELLKEFECQEAWYHFHRTTVPPVIRQLYKNSQAFHKNLLSLEDKTDIEVDSLEDALSTL